MGVLNVSVLCLVVFCVGGLGTRVATPGAPGEHKDYKYNSVMKQLFDEMNSVMSHVVENKRTNGGTGIKSKALQHKVKRILLPKDTAGKNSGKATTDNSGTTTEALGVIRSIFNKVAGEIDHLYVKRRREYERKSSRTRFNVRGQPNYGRRPAKQSTGSNNSTLGGAKGPRKEILRGVDVPSAKNSINPLLNRLKEADLKRKHEYIYYEEASGSDSGRKPSSDAGVGYDDTEQGSGDNDDESGDDDAETESGSGKAPGKSVKVVQGQSHGQVVRHVARARDRKRY